MATTFSFILPEGDLKATLAEIERRRKALALTRLANDASASTASPSGESIGEPEQSFGLEVRIDLIPDGVGYKTHNMLARIIKLAHAPKAGWLLPRAGSATGVDAETEQ